MIGPTVITPAALEDDEGMLAPGVDAIVDHAGCSSTSSTATWASPKSPGADEQVAPGCRRFDDAAPDLASHGIAGLVPRRSRMPGCTVSGSAATSASASIRPSLARGVLRRRLVQDVARVDHRPALEVLAVMDDELACRDVDDRLDAMGVRPDLDPGRDAVEWSRPLHDRWVAARPGGSGRSSDRQVPSGGAGLARPLCPTLEHPVLVRSDRQCSSRLPISSQ